MKFINRGVLGTNQIKVIKRRSKPRTVHKAKNRLTSEVSRFMANRLRKRLPSKGAPDRLRQLRETLNCMEAFPYGSFVDCKKCYESFEVEKFLKRYGEHLWFWERYLVQAVFSSPINGMAVTKMRLRPGLALSDAILDCALAPIQSFAESERSAFLYYVDDLAFFADSKDKLESLEKIARAWLEQFGLKLYDQVGPKFSGRMSLQRDGKHSERLGVLFCRKQGTLFGKLRPSTKRKYLDRVQRKVFSSSDAREAFILVGEVLHGSGKSFYPLYRAFPKDIWSDPIDRKLFRVEVTKIFKKRFGRNVQSERLNDLLWSNGHF